MIFRFVAKNDVSERGAQYSVFMARDRTRKKSQPRDVTQAEFQIRNTAVGMLDPKGG